MKSCTTLFRLLFLVLVIVCGCHHPKPVEVAKVDTLARKEISLRGTDVIRFVSFTGTLDSQAIKGTISWKSDHSVWGGYKPKRDSNEEEIYFYGKEKGDSVFLGEKKNFDEHPSTVMVGIFKARQLVGKRFAQSDTSAIDLQMQCKDWLDDLKIKVALKDTITRNCYTDEPVSNYRIEEVLLYREGKLMQIIRNVKLLASFTKQGANNLIRLDDINNDGYLDLKVSFSVPCKYYEGIQSDDVQYLYDPLTKKFAEESRSYAYSKRMP